MSKKRHNRKSNVQKQRVAPVVATLNNARPNSDTFRNFVNLRPQTTAQVINTNDLSSIRNQARNEVTNNPHALGMCNLFALYVIGSGPRLSFDGYERYLARNGKVCNQQLCDYVEYLWQTFAQSINFTAKLKQAMKTLVVDGEFFLAIARNPKSQLGFDIRLIDGQRIGNPSYSLDSQSLQHGIYFDEFGNIDGYCVYDIPDNSSSYYLPTKYTVYDPETMIHVFREDLPDQTRGISWFASVLPLLQQLREYTASVIESAKTAAKNSISIETTEGFVNSGFADYYYVDGNQIIGAGSTYNTGNGEIRIMSPGLHVNPIQSTQPISGNDAFISSVLNQIGYALGLPRNRATGSSHEYNFASGRLDNQPFELLIKDLQSLIAIQCCDKIFKYFFSMIQDKLIERFELDEIPSYEDSCFHWDFPAPPLVDEESAVRTNAIKLKTGQATISEVYNSLHADSDWVDIREQMRKDREEFPSIFEIQNSEGAEDTKPHVTHQPQVTTEVIDG